LRALWQEPEDDHAVAVSDYGDTPDKINDLRMSGQPRLNGKLSRTRPRAAGSRQLSEDVGTVLWSSGSRA
ncbi:MAG: hypothetical protein ACRDRJ_38330, partial [Streptosporangiaceae bacterium]